MGFVDDSSSGSLPLPCSQTTEFVGNDLPGSLPLPRQLRQRGSWVTSNLASPMVQSTQHLVCLGVSQIIPGFFRDGESREAAEERSAALVVAGRERYLRKP